MRHREATGPGTCAELPSPLERGRECYARRAWLDAWQALCTADQQAPLGGDDLERMAMAAYLLGRDDDYLQALDRAYNSHLAAGENRRAVRCAFWIALRLLFRGETGRATGWLSLAQHLLEREEYDCVEQGYLLLPVVNQQVATGDLEAAHAAAMRAAEIGDRCGEADLSVCARHLQGRVLIEQGQVERGLALLDEAMVGLASGKLSPLITGLTYCSVIEGCVEVCAMARAREWTAALAAWCEAQPDMLAFTGVCRTHRAEIMQWRGEWADAIEEAKRAFECCRKANNARASAAALYQQAEVHRLRGAFAAAEDAYRDARRWGCDPQPGLALLRAAQGQGDAAAAAIDRALRTTPIRLQRARLLPACVEIMLAVGDVDAAHRACDELQEIAASFAGDELDAMAACARGALALAAGNAQAALCAARRALDLWQRVDAPYRAARARLLIGLACRALGDADGCRLELDEARAVFARLGAAPDLARVDALADGEGSARPHGLTRRELQVLRLLATGKTNKAIGAELYLSEKTIDRHVSNILAKLDVPSRAAATARAYEYRLIHPDR